MAVISVKVDPSGRILIPEPVRRQLGLQEGESDLLLDIDETPIRVTTRAQALVRLQEEAAKYGHPDELWSEELLQERRQEAMEESLG
jgi:AbrB family looped-hinge helix DNA binding protein